MKYDDYLRYSMSPTARKIPDDLPRNLLPKALLYQDLNKGVALIRGKQGVGKTTLAVSIAWWLKKLFKRDVIADQMLSGEYFGKYIYYNKDILKRDIKMITKLAETPEMPISEDGYWMVPEEQLPIIYNKVYVQDEAYKKLDRRRSGNAELLTYGDLYLQYRHLNTMFLVVSHSERLLDILRVNEWITHLIDCKFSFGRPGHTEVDIVNVVTGRKTRLDVYIPRYAKMFRSFAPIPQRTNVRL